MSALNVRKIVHNLLGKPVEVKAFEDILFNYRLELEKVTGRTIKLEVTQQGHNTFSESSDDRQNSYLGGMTITVLLDDGNRLGMTRLALFNLNQLPGCCGVVVSNGANVAYNWHNRGIGSILARLRIDICRHFGYTTLLCTDVTSNKPQRRILQKLGWRDVFTFKNSRTGNQVAISILPLHDNADPQFNPLPIEVTPPAKQVA